MWSPIAYRFRCHWNGFLRERIDWRNSCPRPTMAYAMSRHIFPPFYVAFPPVLSEERRFGSIIQRFIPSYESFHALTPSSKWNLREKMSNTIIVLLGGLSIKFVLLMKAKWKASNKVAQNWNVSFVKCLLFEDAFNISYGICTLRRWYIPVCW